MLASYRVILSDIGRFEHSPAMTAKASPVERTNHWAICTPWIQDTEKGEGEMANIHNRGYGKQSMAGFLGLLMAQGATSAEGKFLSLGETTTAFDLIFRIKT